MRYVLIDNYWWVLDTNTPADKATVYNGLGGKMTDTDIRNLKTATAEYWEFLDWKGTSIYNNDYPTGWLSPKGEFFGCEYTQHLQQARYVHNKTENDMEKEGWIKITYPSNKKYLQAIFMGNIMKNVMPTLAQIDWLRLNSTCDYEEVLEYRKSALVMMQEQNKDDDSQEK